MPDLPLVMPFLAQDAAPAGEVSAPPGADVSPPPSADNEAQPLVQSDGTPTGNTAPQAPGLFDGPFMLLLLGFMVLMIVFSISSGRKEKKRKEAMINALTKGKKVQTAGGVLGTITDVRDHEVVVKVDENSNTRIRFAKSAIAAVIED